MSDSKEPVPYRRPEHWPLYVTGFDAALEIDPAKAEEKLIISQDDIEATIERIVLSISPPSAVITMTIRRGNLSRVLSGRIYEVIPKSGPASETTSEDGMRNT